jgi:hypothetical protein
MLGQGKKKSRLIKDRASINMAATYSPALWCSTIGPKSGLNLWTRQKKAPSNKRQGFNKYGSYLLSRIVVQYHRP